MTVCFTSAGVVICGLQSCCYTQGQASAAPPFLSFQATTSIYIYLMHTNFQAAYLPPFCVPVIDLSQYKNVQLLLLNEQMTNRLLCCCVQDLFFAA